jgi:hypothetical protein
MSRVKGETNRGKGRRGGRDRSRVKEGLGSKERDERGLHKGVNEGWRGEREGKGRVEGGERRIERMRKEKKDRQVCRARGYSCTFYFLLSLLVCLGQGIGIEGYGALAVVDAIHGVGWQCHGPKATERKEPVPKLLRLLI